MTIRILRDIMHEFFKRGNLMSRKELFLRKKTSFISILLLIVLLTTGFIWGQKDIKIAVDDTTIQVSTLKSDPVQILKQAGVVLGPNDEYGLSTQKLEKNTTIFVYRAVPVTVTYKGTSKSYMTGKQTVGELLAELGIAADMTKSVPQVDSKITENLEIKVVDVVEKNIEREEQIQYDVIRQPDPTMETGFEEVVTHGENGLKHVTAKIEYHDGQEVAETVLEEKIIQPAKSEIVRVGTRDTVDTSRGTMRFRRTTEMEATAYLPTDGGGAGITATGIAARHGIVAVDPNVIPLGTRLYIPGYGMALAADTGGAIQGNIIDLCVEDYGEAMQFGRRTVKVYILD